MPVLSLEETAEKDWKIFGMHNMWTGEPIWASSYLHFKDTSKIASLAPRFREKPIAFSGLEIFSMPAPYYYTGTCPGMDSWHYMTLMDKGNRNYGKSTLLFYGDTLLGSMEMVGEHSVLALRNIADSYGETLFSMGATYSVNMEIYHAARHLRSKGDSVFKKIDLAKFLGGKPLEVFPRRNIDFPDMNDGWDLFSARTLRKGLTQEREALEKSYAP